jgi:signal transduction histidine kinase
VIDELVRAVERSTALGPGGEAVVAAALSRARTVQRAGGGDEHAERVAATTFLADVLAGLVLERDLSRAEAARMVERGAAVVGVAPAAFVLEVSLRALRDPALLELPPGMALELELKKLHVLCGAREASLWMGRRGEALHCLVHLGTARPTPRVRGEARRALDGFPNETPAGRDYVHAIPIIRWQQPVAALVARVKPEHQWRAAALVEAAATVVAPVLEKEGLLERSTDRERALVEATDRRLTRLGFDLHDSVIQDVAALAGDVRHFKQQLADPGNVDHRLLGRCDDIEARLIEIDAGLREVARSLQPPTVVGKSIPEALEDEIRLFRSRSTVRAKLEVEGELDNATPSQRIAVSRLVQEALSNVREHSGATEVVVSVEGRHGHVRVQVFDNGRGFDVEKTLIQAAKGGRLGLVGMSERVRLLGGFFDVQSQPGGPTTVLAALPEWQPLTRDPRATVAVWPRHAASPS